MLECDDDRRLQAEGRREPLGSTVAFGGIGFDGDRDDSAVHGFLKQSGDLEPAESVRFAELHFRSTLNIVLPGQLSQEPAVSGGGCCAHDSPLGIDGGKLTAHL
ncbi:hypothetical protein GCM10009691_40680 [Brevibacterium picturae]|uniref:Uncharacterized protein n=1 Tax=Brevibacterium picturae TaxID=260553 RepID=A0ABP4NLS0_9MICO